MERTFLEKLQKFVTQYGAIVGVADSMIVLALVFAVQTFDNLGTQWAGTLLGCLAAAMIPIPFIFYRWDPEIRAKSKFAPTTSVESLEELEDGEKQVRLAVYRWEM